MRRLFSLMFILLLLLSLSGCGNWDETSSDDPFSVLYDYYQSENTPPEPIIPDHFTLPYFSGDTLNPLVCTDTTLVTICPLLYESLFELDETFTPYPVLAKTISYDGPVYTITLRDDVVFSDGEPLSAADVQSVLLNAQLSDRYGTRLSNIQSIRVLDSLTLEITLMQIDGNLEALLDIPIIKKGTENTQFPVGTGPYVFIAEENQNLLIRNSAWWQNKHLPIHQIHLLPCKGSETAVYAFSVRDIQLVVCDLTGTAATTISGSGNYTDANTSLMLYLGFNTQNPLLSRSDARRAINLAFNRSSLINAYFLGHGKPAQFPISPANPLYPADLELATTASSFTQAMQRAGLATNEEIHELTLLVNSENDFKQTLATEIASLLTRHDLVVSVVSLPWDEYLTALQMGNYDLYIAETKLNSQWDISSLAGTGGQLNYSGYSSEILDSMLRVFQETSGSAHEVAAHSLYSEFQYEMPFIPLGFKNLSVLTAESIVENVYPTATNPYYLLSNWKIHLAT